MATNLNTTNLTRRAALTGGASVVTLAGASLAGTSGVVRPSQFITAEMLLALSEELRGASKTMTLGAWQALQIAADLIEAICGVRGIPALLPFDDELWADRPLLAELQDRALRRISG